ncbi:hypothetical protein [Helicobacter bilis]|uniref:hypothetical protein n=1 Tax=Helicobacter bilis TaxID=37372 RepID=UPI00051DC2A7|nr:hypothetical protein [Helicobacter bilis]MCI7411443.1 hypothetical protein [Helicobacter bilis]MDD7296064.1 hypothetical protein [Helicobacter bilis]MDY4399822.1 hypothetical protein [Helicobacter bilis]TLE07509.1 hypothetical protein LS78_008925 [Helicobacter bilis]
MIVTSICMLGVLLLLSNGACRLSLKDSKTSFSRKVLIVFSLLSLICFLPIIENVSIVKHIYSYFDSPSFFVMILICAACLRLVDFRVRNNKNRILKSNTWHVELEPSERETSNMESKRDISPFSKAQYGTKLDSKTTTCHIERSKISNTESKKATFYSHKHCIESSNIGFNIYTALILFIYGAILYGGSLGMIDFYLQELAIQSSHLQDFDTHAFNPLNINTFSTQAFDIYHATLLNQALISFVLLVLLYISNKEIGILALFSFILFCILSGENTSLLECFICPYLWLYSIFYIVYRILLRFYRFVSIKIHDNCI